MFKILALGLSNAWLVLVTISCARPNSGAVQTTFAVPAIQGRAMPVDTDGHNHPEVKSLNIFFMRGFYHVKTGIVMNNVWNATITPNGNDSTGIIGRYSVSVRSPKLSLVIDLPELSLHYKFEIVLSNGSNIFLYRDEDTLKVQQTIQMPQII